MSVIAYDKDPAASAVDDLLNPQKPTAKDAEQAVRTLLEWIGDDPDREGLVDTPKRVTNAFKEWFSGYSEDPEEILARTFEEVEGYNDIVLLKDIRLESYCEHHIAPIIGKAHIAYLPRNKVVGISKLARLIDIYAKRLQVQEKLTAQVADTLTRVLDPRGVAIMIDAEHQCMSTRGVHKPGVGTITTRFTGVFNDDPKFEQRFFQLIGR
ncbi:MAG: GTP cyclohydrolase I FolE [Pseudomonadota bacterium]